MGEQAERPMDGQTLPQGLIDTAILIDASRKHPPAIQFMNERKRDGMFFISVIAVMELTQGCQNKRGLRESRRTVASASVLPITAPVSDRAAKLMERFWLSHSLEIPDALVAATALELGWPLYTRNVKHFRMIPNLRVIEPY